ncbi:cell wall SED1 [Fusarium beomiforme]|uniref:Cell wall SED1 n=1 Tax=Fusarium beomiforme TaxID=44412 RepID=A0A9P5A3N0_9HYPO|nr:cell wall SED1 [Fusarium beomiforme]
MSPVPKPPYRNETEHATAEILVATVTSEYSFYCPEPKTFHHKGVTYMATEPTYLTITNCTCTITYAHNPKSPGASVYPMAPPGQSAPNAPPMMSSSAAAPAPPHAAKPVSPPAASSPAHPPPEYSAPIPRTTTTPS